MQHLKYRQILPISVDQAWEFFSSPTNLKTITPNYLQFEMTSQEEEKQMYAGQMIIYRIRPLWQIPIKWVTEITHVQKPLYFIDEQRFGPYNFWHHEHRFKPVPGGTEISDMIYYKLPLGPLGSLINRLKVRKDLENIFAFRKAKLEELFGKYPS
ncbi:MAG: SRPBCC family protein [Verrucomicrobia bacterium]|nr:SRPBCC family protein [Verrucomicrobiota bacterium]